MKHSILASATCALVAGSILLAPQSSPAQSLREAIETVVKEYLATHPEEIGRIAKDYLIKHPEFVGEIVAEQLKRRPGADTSATAPSAKLADRRASVAANAALLFSSPRQVTLGNPAGDVTLVEFLDYGCGFCKRALPDLLTLLNDDPKLRIVIKEFPILGPGSSEAAQVAIAVRMQDTGAQRYLAFHRQLLGDGGPASRDKALAAARDQGLDMERLQRDMASEEVRTTLEETMKLARALGISGTPSYVVGNDVVPGAVGAVALKARISSARAQRIN